MRYRITLASFALVILGFFGLCAMDRSGIEDRGDMWGVITGRLTASSPDSLPVRILHIGDSHVRGKGFAAGVDSILASHYRGHYVYESSGINGSTYQTWLSEYNIRQIVNAKPDLLIVSLGTNDSYSSRFAPEVMRSNMEAFYAEVRRHLPDVAMVCTTPPASYLRQSRRVAHRTTRRKRKPRTVYRYTTTYHFNGQTQRACRLVHDVSKELGLVCIDLNSYIGTEGEASKWLGQGLMHTDHVHYTVPGYLRQGQWVGGELIKIIEARLQGSVSHE